MQKRTRRPHGINTRKISISVSDEDLKVLATRAKRAFSGNVSAVVHELIDTLRRLEAADQVLAMLNGGRVREADIQSIRDEVSRSPKRRSTKKSAA